MLRPEVHDHLRVGFDLPLLPFPECGILGPLLGNCTGLDLGGSGREDVFRIASGVVMATALSPVV